MMQKLSYQQLRMLRLLRRAEQLCLHPGVRREDLKRMAASFDTPAGNGLAGPAGTLCSLLRRGLAEPLPEDWWMVRITEAGRNAIDADEPRPGAGHGG